MLTTLVTNPDMRRGWLEERCGGLAAAGRCLKPDAAICPNYTTSREALECRCV